MDTEYSNWNGYDVHGDIKELDAIVESTGFININKEDVIEVLSAKGENFVTSGTDLRIVDAITKAIKELPYPINKITRLLISLHCGKILPNVIDISKIRSVLPNAGTDMDVSWGIAKDDTLGDSFKVILVASTNR